MADDTRYYEVDSGTGCWIWSMGVSSTGYGIYNFRRGEARNTQLAHRWMYERKLGPIPQGYDLDHLCRTPRCVNPNHLEPVLPSVNCQRGAKAKVTEADVEHMRYLAATTRMTQVDIGKLYGLHGSHVSRILSGKRWPKQPGPRSVAA